MSTTQEIEKERMTRHRSSPTCKALFDVASPELFRKNAFRITGLSVDATAREITKHADKLKMLADLGQDPHTQSAAFPMKPPPSLDEIREAVQNLKDPEKRVVDEFFWFWPEEFGHSQSDPAIQALAKGDSKTAVEIWASRENGEQSGLTAKHNLAIVYHVCALDWENYSIKNVVEAQRRQKIADYWKGAFSRWETLATNEQMWDKVVARIRQLDEPNLPTGFARRMRATLPEALDKINAELAVAFAESDKLELARLQIRFMRERNQELGNFEKTAELVLTPARNRLKEQVRRAKDRADKNPSDAANAARELLGQAQQTLGLFALFFGDQNDVRNEFAIELLETIYSLIQSGLNLIQKSTVHPRLKLEQVRSGFFEFLPAVENFGKQHANSSSIATKVMDSVAWALRGIAIEAYNAYQDFGTTYEGLDMALQWCRGPEVRQRIQGDLKTLGVQKDATNLRQASTSASQPKQKKQPTVRRLPNQFGDAGGEHTRMERGSYDGGIYVLFAFVAEVVCAGILGLSFITNILKIPCDETASWIVGALAGLGISFLIFWNRWKCIEAFASQFCCGVANLSIFYVPVVALCYANWRGVKKVFSPKEWEESSANKSSRLALVIAAVVLVLGIVGSRDGNKSVSTGTSYTPPTPTAATYTPPPVEPSAPVYTPPPVRESGYSGGNVYSVSSYVKSELDRESSGIEADRAVIEANEAQIKQLGREIENDRIYLDHTSQYAVSEFNAKVDRYNTLSRAAKAENAAFNAKVNAYNEKLRRNAK
jgi:hypothetical protein